MLRNDCIKRICIIFSGGLGDVVLLLPSLLTVRKAYPCAHIEILGNPLWLELLQERGYVDKTHSLEQVPVHLLFQSDLPQTHPFLGFLQGFDLLISWFGDRQGMFEQNIRYACKSRVFVFPFQNHQYFAGHVSEYYLSTLEKLAIPVGPPQYKLLTSRSSFPVREGPRAEAHRPSKPLLCIHPGSGSQAKNWPLRHFIHVARELTLRLPVQVSLVLGPAENGQSQEVRMLDNVQSITVVEGLSVSALAVLFERSSLYLGNDSGPTHLAASTGVCTVALFGPTSKEKWYPKGPNVNVIHAMQACSPCDDGLLSAFTERPCSMEITPDKVLKVILSLMRAGP